MSLQIWLPLNGDLKNNGCNASNPVQTSTPTYVDGKIGKAITSGGFKIEASDVAKFYNNKAMSFAFWIYPIGSSGSIILGKNNMSAGDNRMFSIFQYPNPVDIHLSWQNETSNSPFLSVVWSNVLTASVWNHVAITYNGTTATLYVNGIQKGTTSGVSNRTNFSYDVPYSGNDNRRLCDLRIYDHCLSVAEVKELAKGLVCHYKLDTLGLDNLLRFTQVNEQNKAFLVSYIGSNWNNINIATIKGKKCYHYPSASGPSAWNSGSWCKLEANTTYTYSAWIYFTASRGFNMGSLGHFQVYNASSTASDKSHEDVASARIFEPSTIPANTWTKIRITFTTNSLNGSSFIVYPRYNIAANTGDLYFRDCKLEKNSTPTGWVPNLNEKMYQLLDVNSTKVTDSSGYKFNGTKTGTIGNTSSAPRYNTCTSFNNNTAQISVMPYLSNGQTVNEMSVSCWYRTNTLNNTAPNLWSLGQNMFLRLRLASNTAIWYYARVGTTMSSNTVEIGKTIIDNAWHHVVLTFKNGVFVLYFDGVLINTKDFSSTAKYLTCGSVGSTWWLGGYTGSSEKFIGSLSDFRIYATALSATDILRLYNTGGVVNKNGQLLGYEFNEMIE